MSQGKQAYNAALPSKNFITMTMLGTSIFLWDNERGWDCFKIPSWGHFDPRPVNNANILIKVRPENANIYGRNWIYIKFWRNFPLILRTLRFSLFKLQWYIFAFFARTSCPRRHPHVSLVNCYSAIDNRFDVMY